MQFDGWQRDYFVDLLVLETRIKKSIQSVFLLVGLVWFDLVGLV